MSVNWVMTHPTKEFEDLPNERRIWKSPPRTAISISTPKGYPGNEPINHSSSAGTIYLTNQRIVYLPAQSSATAALKSFASPLINLHDTHVSAPFFGPNVWHAVLQPVHGGGLTTASSYVEIKLTFKDGGAYDFQSRFEVAKEKLGTAVELARERNLASGSGGRNGNVDLSQVNLEDLPAYEAEAGPAPTPSAAAANIPSTTIPSSSTPSSTTIPTATATDSATIPAPSIMNPAAPPPPPPPPSAPPITHQQSFQPPAEPPPGYEEAQQQSIAEEFERRLSQPNAAAEDDG